MSGHSKWSKIKHQKGIEDAKRGKVFSQLARQITLAVKQGGSGDPNQNANLRLALGKAGQANLPKENIKRAINRGLGQALRLGEQGRSGSLSEVVVEGYGPGGVAIMVRAQTDNQNRTKSELRTIFSKRGGSVGEPGSVGYVFLSGKPSFMIPLQGNEADRTKRLIESLEGHEDVEQVLHNAELNG